MSTSLSRLGENADTAAQTLVHSDDAPVRAQVAADRDDLALQYFQMLSGEDIVVAPDALLRQVAGQVNDASKRPQTATIVRLVAEIQALGACKPDALTALSGQLARELAKSDNQLWGELEGEDDDFFLQIGASLDSVYG